ncbi:thiopurine S-methyltransferase [Tritonibacter litoralis]|nr:thiopurine S-methyltransferase [Tritonibacter litoralis]
MNEEFWQTLWKEGRIGFHEGTVNDFLARFYSRLNLVAGNHILVPLCGKSFDLDWLLAKGLIVTGVEFNQGAVEEVFARLNLTPEVDEIGPLRRYRSGALTLFAGDFYAVTSDLLGPVDAVYDRAAMVAIQPETRANYAAHVVELTGGAQQLLIGFDYDQNAADGPPFSLAQELIMQAYGAQYTIELLKSIKVGGPFADGVDADEQIWYLQPKG